jgi:hypothetical protein
MLCTRLPAATVAFAALCQTPLASAQPPAQPAVVPVAAQTPAPPPAYVPTSLAAEPGLPRTPDGHPDFQSIVWASNFFPVFESNPMSASLSVSEAEAKKMVQMMVAGFLKSPDPNIKIDPEVEHIMLGNDGLPLVRGERRTRMVVLPATGKVPLAPEVRKKLAATGPLGADTPLDNPEQRPVGERCLALTAQAPMATPIAYTRFRFIQTPTYVVIHSENGDEIRIVPFADVHKPAVTRSWLGESIARWDGDTLVVETIHAPKEAPERGFSNFIVNPDSKVIERFTRLSQTELLYQFTVEDPKVYTAPWLAEYSLYSTSTGMFPSPCHEGNYSLPNILQGARVADARAAKKP